LTTGIAHNALIVEYDGANYSGFQLQAKESTIQAELEKALLKLTGERVRIKGASRTDAGVHALGQVVSFKTESGLSPETLKDGLNHFLPEDIAVQQACGISEGFDVRRRAESREYQYLIIAGKGRSPLRRHYAYQIKGELDVAVMNEACTMITGEHDLVSFASELQPHVKRTVRKVFQAGVKKLNEMVIFNIKANSFLPHQVRNTVGALIRIGQDKMTLDEFNSIIEARKAGAAGPNVPACGLCLVRVNYPKPLETEQ